MDTAAYAGFVARQMWPDLYPENPHEELDKMIVQDFLIRDNARIRLDWHVRAHAAGLPIAKYGSTTHVNVTQYDDAYNIDEQATIKVFAKVVKYARGLDLPVKKDYGSNDFNLRIQVSEEPDVEITYYANRDIMCTKVHIGTEVIPAEPEKVVDKYNWECEKIAFLGIDTD